MSEIARDIILPYGGLIILLSPMLCCLIGVMWEIWRASLVRRKIVFLLKGITYLCLRKVSSRAIQLRKELSYEASQLMTARRR